MFRILSFLGIAALSAGCALSEGTAPGAVDLGGPNSSLVNAKEMKLGGGVFSPSVQTIAVADTIYYSFVGGTHNVVFTPQLTAPADVPVTASPNTVKRVFEHAGAYDFACTRHAGMVGRVFVR